MKRGCQRFQATDQGGRGSVQQFVSNAVHAASLDRSHLFPAPVADNFSQGDSVAGAAPGRYHDVWIFRQD
jgi:hypothetical protein